jgi:hypothetical protein
MEWLSVKRNGLERRGLQRRVIRTGVAYSLWYGLDR